MLPESESELASVFRSGVRIDSIQLRSSTSLILAPAVYLYETRLMGWRWSPVLGGASLFLYEATAVHENLAGSTCTSAREETIDQRISRYGGWHRLCLLTCLATVLNLPCMGCHAPGVPHANTGIRGLAARSLTAPWRAAVHKWARCLHGVGWWARCLRRMGWWTAGIYCNQGVNTSNDKRKLV